MTAITILKGEKDVMSFDARQPIFAEGEVGHVMYAVIEGEVDIVFRGRVIETIGEGGIFGEMALIEREPRSADAVARTACRLAAIDLRRFGMLVQQAPFFALEVMRAMAHRLRRETR
jgi:CRP-like cAMP-binding protein